MLRYAYRPFDLRWVYWEPETKLLDRAREEYIAKLAPNGLALVLPHQNRASIDGPLVVSNPADINTVDGSATVFPVNIVSNDLLSNSALLSNSSQEMDAFLRARESSNTELALHLVATLHTPKYLQENGDALRRDWPRVPLPATAELLSDSANLGRRLAELLDAESSISLAAGWSFLAALKLPLDPNLEEALKLTAGWGHKGQGSTVMPGRGVALERPWSQAEREKLAALTATQSLALDDALTLLGETCIDVRLNGNAQWSAVPISVWNYTLGGYQVLKKWLSYREFTSEPASPLLHRALRSEEAAYFAQVVRRIAAILLLGPALDASYRAILPTATGLSAAAHR